VEALRIAFLPLVRTTFDVPLAETMIGAARQSLLAAGFELTGPTQGLTDLAAAQTAAIELASTPVDLLLVFFYPDLSGIRVGNPHNHGCRAGMDSHFVLHNEFFFQGVAWVAGF